MASIRSHVREAVQKTLKTAAATFAEFLRKIADNEEALWLGLLK